MFRHLAKGNTAKSRGIVSSLILDTAFALLDALCDWKPVRSNNGEKRRYVFGITFGLVNGVLKSTVGPHNFTVLIKERIRKVKLSEKLSLDLSVLRSEADKFVHYKRLVIEIQYKGNRDINNGKHRQKPPCGTVNGKGRNVYYKQQYSQINCKSQVRTKATLYPHFSLHANPFIKKTDTNNFLRPA